MVVIDVDGLPVIFPYERLYPEQREYMLKLKQALDCKGHAVLEMPSGTGKTITLLALITAHISNRPDAAGRKFVYCTRTVEEMQKVMGEMKLLTATREHETKQMNKLVTVGLASRRHLCVHERVSRVDGESIDSACRSLTAPWVREAAKHTIDVSGNVSAVEVCKYFENFDSEGENVVLRPGVYDLSDLRAFGRRRNWCPYFTARRMLGLANVIVYSYHCAYGLGLSSLCLLSSPICGKQWFLRKNDCYLRFRLTLTTCTSLLAVPCGCYCVSSLRQICWTRKLQLLY